MNNKIKFVQRFYLYLIPLVVFTGLAEIAYNWIYYNDDVAQFYSEAMNENVEDLQKLSKDISFQYYLEDKEFGDDSNIKNDLIDIRIEFHTIMETFSVKQRNPIHIIFFSLNWDILTFVEKDQDAMSNRSQEISKQESHPEIFFKGYSDFSKPYSNRVENNHKIVIPLWRDNGDVWGFIHGEFVVPLGVFQEKAYEHFFVQTKWIIAYNTLLVMVLYLIGWSVTKPFNQFINHVKQVSSSGLKQVFCFESNIVELDILESILNAMRTDILSQQKQLIAARDQAMTSSHAKSSFLANMSHEMRTPLNGIIGFSDLLNQEDLTEKQKLYLNHITSSGSHLLALINDILDLSKIQAGKLSLESTPFNLKTMVHQCVEHFRLVIKKNEALDISYALFPGVPTNLVGDPHRLRQILFNLLSNAVKFTEQGQIALFVECRDQTKTEAEICFLVDDTGVGLEPKFKEKLFQPFTQSDVSTTRRYGGTGLGLSISTYLANLMGGGIQVESCIGLGSSFRFFGRFDISDTEVIDATVFQLSDNELLYNKLTNPLLVVEDDPVNRLFISELLKSLGVTHFDVANNGKEALQCFVNKRYALILMDCQMPQMDGYHATRRIRRLEQEKGLPRIPIIALTANVASDNQQKCFASGMDDFLSKPIQISLLVEKINTWLQIPQTLHPKIPRTMDEKRIELKKEHADSEKPFELSGLEELKRTLGEEGFSLIAQAFIEGVPEKLEYLKKAVMTENSEDLRKMAHILKGNSGMIQAKRVYNLYEKLLDLGKSGTTDGAQDILDAVLLENQLVVDVLKKHLTREG